MTTNKPKGFATRAIHAGQDPQNWDSNCITPPIVTSINFQLEAPDKEKFLYSRVSNPNRNILEECLASLEESKHGLCFSAGLGTCTAIMGLFKSGDHLIISGDVYGGSLKNFTVVGSGYGIESTVVDASNLDEVKDAIRPNTKLIYFESPSNPTNKLVDIKAICNLAKPTGILVAIDNTFLTPYFQQPLKLGVHLSTYSLTKYMNGHNDVLMGAIMFDDDELYKKLKFLQNILGLAPSPTDCAMVVRSLKTLSLRMRQHSSNALEIAKFFETHPKVLKVLHPGLPCHPQHDLYKQQSSGHSGMLAVYLKGGMAETRRFVKAMKLFLLAASLGGCQSLVAVPALMTHSGISQELRDKTQITDNLLRISIGIEDVEDLIDDLKVALDAV